MAIACFIPYQGHMTAGGEHGAATGLKDTDK